MNLIHPRYFVRRHSMTINQGAPETDPASRGTKLSKRVVQCLRELMPSIGFRKNNCFMSTILGVVAWIPKA